MEMNMSTNDGRSTMPPSYRAAQTPVQKFGKTLRKLRTERGLTQIQLAIAAELNRSFICDLERGVKEPALGTQAKLAEVFCITISELMKDI